jgi:hypothetical protein
VCVRPPTACGSAGGLGRGSSPQGRLWRRPRASRLADGLAPPACRARGWGLGPAGPPWPQRAGASQRGGGSTCPPAWRGAEEPPPAPAGLPKKDLITGDGEEEEGSVLRPHANEIWGKRQ